jgi:trimeric autotransporter adhesin
MRGSWTNVRRIIAITVVAAAGAVAAPAAASKSSFYTVWTIAGSSAQCTTPPSCGGSGVATKARLSFPEAVAVGRAGNVFIADMGDNEIREVKPNGQVTVVAGNGAFCQHPPNCGDGGKATDAELGFPSGIAVDGAGNVYVADTQDNEIRKIAPSGTITRVAGTGAACGRPPSCGDGGLADTATLTNPAGLAIDRAGNLYIADAGDQEIRKLSKSGTITRVAGTGKWCAHPPSCGDGAAATKARLRFPQAVALGPSGKWYIADGGDQEIREVSSAGKISTVAGTGKACSQPPSCGDGGPATSAKLNFPTGVAVGPAGGVFIADAADHELREVEGGKISRLAGDGAPCAKPPACGDNHASASSTLNYPSAVVSDQHGNLYLADSGDNEVRWLSRAKASHISTPSGFVALAAFSPKVTKKAVVVRFILGQPAHIVLTVHHSGHSAILATRNVQAGFGEAAWNRRFRGKPAAKGRYRLIVSAAIGHGSASSPVRVRLS